MSAPSNRSTIVQLVITAVVCIGGYVLMVEPLRAQLIEVESQLDARAAEVARLATISQTVPQLEVELTEVHARAQRVRQRSTLALNNSELYAQLSALAEKNKVRLDRIEPVQSIGRAKAATGEEGARVSRVGYNLTAVARYANLAAFLNQLDSSLGYTSIRTVRLAPHSGEDPLGVVATIQTMHHAFDPGEFAEDAK